MEKEEAVEKLRKRLDERDRCKSDSTPSPPREKSDDEASDRPSARELSETSSDAGSDADDVFDLKTAAEDVLPEGYKDLFLYRWQLAAKELSDNHLREELTLPLDPSLEKQSEIWGRVDEAVMLPAWHCGSWLQRQFLYLRIERIAEP